MLVRAGVIMARGEGRDRVKQALQINDAFVIGIKPREIATRAPREALDIAVVGPGAGVADVGTELAERLSHVAALRALPDPPEVVCVLEVEGADAAEAQAALLQMGCAAVIPEGLPMDKLEISLKGVLDRVQAHRTDAWLTARREGHARLEDFSVRSPVMRQFMGMVHRVVSSDTSLLILGETGVGKEHLARALHSGGPRASGPFVAVNCGALPEGILESELFGHEKGAFTGAVRSRRGHFEMAHGGTLFLDEIGELPLHLQSKLLRALQERLIQPLGSERQVPVDVRILAATNRDLGEEAQARRFRSDLFYRLAVVSLTLPPLRERKEDIPELAERYLEQYCRRLGREIDQITPEAMQALRDYDWPGNVRELANVIERAVLLCTEDEISLQELPDAFSGGLQIQLVEPGQEPEPDGPGHLPARLVDLPWRSVRAEVLNALERDYLTALMTQHRGRVGEVAEHAGMDPRSLFEKLKRHHLRKEDFKSA
ncbi:MAG: sigma-54 interaction domain-containing protein [Bradymonadia bacterium]